MPPPITSTSNQLIKRIRRLKQKKYRQAEQAFFVEGVHVVAAALESGAEVEQLIWCDELLTSDFGRNLIRSAPCPTAEVNETVFQSVSDRQNPIGLAAIVRSSLDTLTDFTPRNNTPIAALCNIADPGNLGTIIRTADATGAQAVVLVGTTVDPFHPTVLKASMGAFFSVPVLTCDSEAELSAWCAMQNAKTIATSAKASDDYTKIRREVANSLPVLLMGSEQKGLSADELKSADYAVSIPMHGVSSSLNLAVATGLLLYEFIRP